MKSIFFLMFVIFVNTVKSQSTTEILNGCQLDLYYGTDLWCPNFQHTYLPYTEEWKGIDKVSIHGNFTELIIDPAYDLTRIYIESTNLQQFEFQYYSHFTRLNYMDVYGSEQVVNVNFTGAEKLVALDWLSINGNEMVNFPCESLKYSNLTSLTLSRNNLTSFDFACLPKTIRALYLADNKISTLYSQNCETMNKLSNLTHLRLNGNRLTDFTFTCFPQNLRYLSLDSNQISTISNESCQSLKNHTSLRSLLLKSNNLQSFQFGCLPTSIKYVKLSYNHITEINDLSDIPDSHTVDLSLNPNPIRCTCSFLRDYVQQIESYNVWFNKRRFSSNSQTIECANVESELANYPWSNSPYLMKLHDASSLGCLTSGENTDTDNYNNNRNNTDTN